MGLILNRAFGLVKTPRFSTIMQETSALQGTVAIAAAQYPIWDFKISIPQVTGQVHDPTSNIAQLLDLFLTARGRCGTWTLSDPEDYLVTSFTIGIGDGVSKTYQLLRPVGTFQDIVQNVDYITGVYLNGVPTTAYAIDNKGVITFNTSPGVGVAVSWSGAFNFLCRFKSDSLQDLTEYFSDRWGIATLEFESVLR